MTTYRVIDNRHPPVRGGGDDIVSYYLHNYTYPVHLLIVNAVDYYICVHLTTYMDGYATFAQPACRHITIWVHPNTHSHAEDRISLNPARVVNVSRYVLSRQLPIGSLSNKIPADFFRLPTYLP